MSPHSARVAGIAAAGLLALGFSAPAAWAETDEEEGLAEAAVSAAPPVVLPEPIDVEAAPEPPPEPVPEPVDGAAPETLPAEDVEILQEEDPDPTDPPEEPDPDPTDPPEDPDPTDPPEEPDPDPTDPPEEPDPTDPPEDPDPTEPPEDDPPAASGPGAEPTETQVAAAGPPAEVSTAAGLPVTGSEIGPLVIAGVAVTGLGAAAAFAARRREQPGEG